MLSVYNLDEAEQWDKIVNSFENIDVYYLSGYVKAFHLHGDGDPLLFYFEKDNLRAINVVMKRDIADDIHFRDKLAPNTYFDFATPYGYGGWIIEGNGESKQLYQDYIQWCTSNNIVSEFVRFSLFSNSIGSYYGEIVPRTNNVVRNLNLPLDLIMKDFKQKVRKNLKRAHESGLEIIIDEKGTYLEDFLSIYYSTMDRNSAETDYYFTKTFFENLNTLYDHFIYFHVLFNGKIISTELVLLDHRNMYSFLGGTNKDYFEYRPNDYLKYEIIKWGNEKGYSNFILGGGYGGDDGIYRYKKSFAPNGILKFYTGQYIFNSSTYANLCQYRHAPMTSGYFPSYRV